ncbi:MAG TPA: YhjD/YihY/BrkB family envelope integrity protein, partial [Sandaracinaceae bacterium LLY-WYZ-13_1]|nr:YhjD/YihY/BrkB family envelope integrity protein [Sandaracinaceae bacterium LLY-WYZ-13_1]
MSRASNALESWLFASDDDHPWWRRFGMRFLRVHYLAVRGFVRDEGFHHASALAFDTVLALVPLLVIVVGVLRALGAYEAFVTTTLTPWIETTFTQTPEDMVTLREAFLKVLELGEQADVRALGSVGVIALLYLVLILLTTVETSLNQIWGARKPRSLLRRAADYAAILFVLPLGLFLATALGSGLGDLTWLGGFRFVVREIVAIVAASSVLTFLYMVMPYTQTRLLSATLGGLVAGSLWHVGLIVYASFQIGVARYNMLYSGFATLPLFLVWVFVSWLFVLFGAELAAAHQDERAFRWRVREGEASAHTRHRLGVRFTAEITRAFVRGEEPPSLRTLADEASMPERLVEDVLDDLASRGLVLRAIRGGVPTYVLTRDPRSVRITTVLAALDEHGDPEAIGTPRADEEARQLAALVGNLESASAETPANLTLRELV